MHRHVSKARVVAMVVDVFGHILDARMLDNSPAVKNSIQQTSSIVGG
jgi:hypothetical protein